jgi:hypothetical protein
MAESNNLTQSKDDVTDEFHSQITLQSDDSMQNRTRGGVESNQKIMVSSLVQAPLGIGRRSLLR